MLTKRLKTWLEYPPSRLILGGWLGSVGLVLYGSLSPNLSLNTPVQNSDKVMHILAYAWLAFWPKARFAALYNPLILGLGLILFGLGIEVGQILIPGRMFSLADIAANTLGITMGLIAASSLKSFPKSQ